jgi:putative methylase
VTETLRRLAQELGVVVGFEEPHPGLEQYHTPAELAAHIIHVADLHGDIDGRAILDLGSGTGMLSLGAALRGPERVIGVEVDPKALQTARENEQRVGTRTDIEWIHGDVTEPPLQSRAETTVVMNPPFGAQDGNRHADRAFLKTAARHGTVSYSVHNAGSESFVKSFAADNGGSVTHAFQAELELPHQFSFHSEEERTLDTEIFRISWGAGENDT